MKKLLFMALMFPLVCNAQVFKCDVNGKKVYQQNPCAGKVDVVAIDAPPSAQEQAAARARLETYKRNKADAAYRNARANRFQAAQQARQARALEEGNILESYRRY